MNLVLMVAKIPAVATILALVTNTIIILIVYRPVNSISFHIQKQINGKMRVKNQSCTKEYNLTTEPPGIPVRKQ